MFCHAAIRQIRDEIRQLREARGPVAGWVDVQGLAEFMGVSMRTVRRMVVDKEVATKRVGRALRVGRRRRPRRVPGGSVRTVRRMVAHKEVATKRVGRALRFDLAQFQGRRAA